MATTPNHGIVYPVVGNTITPLATHFANLANSVDTAMVTLSNGLYGYIGLDSARAALSGARLREGVQWYSTDTNLEWFYNGTAWRLVPGQLLASGAWTADGAAAAGFQIGVVSTPTLPSGQRVQILPDYGSVYSAAVAYPAHGLRVLAGGTVTSSSGTQVGIGRGEAPGSSFVVSLPSQPKIYTMPSSNTLSAGIFVVNAISLFGADGQSLAVYSA